MRASSLGLPSAALLLSVALVGSSCRGAEGKPCREAEDCRDGLVCVVNGVVLQPGDPPSAQVGECSEDDMLMQSETNVPPPEMHDDLPSMRDLGAEDSGDGDSGGDGDAGDGDGTDGGDGDGTSGGDGDETTSGGDGDETTGGGDGDGG